MQNALQTGTGGQPWASARERRHRRGDLPSIRTLSGLLGSVFSELRGMGRAAALTLAQPLQSCPHRPPLHWDLTSTFLVPAPSQGVPGTLQLCDQGKQNQFVLSWRRSRVGRVLISSSDTCGLQRPGLAVSLWAAVGPCLLTASLLTGWSVF